MQTLKAWTVYSRRPNDFIHMKFATCTIFYAEQQKQCVTENVLVGMRIKSLSSGVLNFDWTTSKFLLDA